MTTTRLQPDRLFQRALKGHTLYSHVVVATGKSLVFIAGQLSRDQEGRVVGAGDMAAQIRQVGDNLRIALEAAGLGLKDLVKTTLPTSTTVEVRRLSHPDLMVEVEAMAVIEQ
jgi:enamine deaminase RidA (YjgF/YER057c/UK114 family)